MMAETTVEKAVCLTCGAEVRDESLFCYNCGKSVTEVPETAASENKIVEVVDDKRPPLKSAASLRKHRRAFNRQPVEISWEPREGASGIFVVATLVLSFAALVLLLLAFYLR